MQPFEMPDFYVPWPARKNPNLDSARAHSKAWAKEIGILNSDQNNDGPKIWDEHDFDRHDYALFCAYIHPETTGLELNLMSDWNVWAFYVDDLFLKVYKRSQDHTGAKLYLERILLFMPIDLSSPPAPKSPTERGLADLWLRTAPSKSEAWRSRIIESTRSLLETSILELDSMSQQRLANPIEYIDMRRQVGGALWSADLVEHAVFVEVPDRIAATRPMLVLKSTFADAVHLRNDIFSYEREVIKEGELTNAVLVIQHFLDTDTQHAVNIVNDLLTSRLQQFEHTVLTELMPLFDEYRLDPLEQANVLTYIRGLQDWQSGAHEWHIQTSRYLNPNIKQQGSTFGCLVPSLGTSAMRITPGTLGLNRFKNYMNIPYKAVGPTQLPEFYMPFTTSLNHHFESARQHSKAWAYKMEMIGIPLGYPNICIWDEHKFDADDVTFFCALAHPDKQITELNLYACWIVWATYADDYFAQVYGHTRDITGAKLCHTRLSEFMPLEPISPSSIPLTPLERSLADLWPRTTASLPVSVRCLFRKIIEGMVGSWVWEMSNRAQNRIPDPIDYAEMRRKTSGSDLVIAFSNSTKSDGIPPDVFRTRTIKELNNCAIDYVYLTNDICSHQLEMESEGDIHNGVLVIQNFLGCDQIQAVNIVNKLMTARIKQFEYIVATELPALFENFDLDTNARTQLLNHAKELKHFMCASLQWHKKTRRYKQTEFQRHPKPFADGPAGLGTAAAHILSRIGHANPIEIAVKPADLSILQTQEKLSETSNTVKTFAISHLQPSFLKKKAEAQPD